MPFRCLYSALALWLLLPLGLVVPGSAGASPGSSALQASEPRVKAAFLFKFGDYVEWPAGSFEAPTAPLTIGVLDANPLADELAAIVVGRQVGGRPVAVRRLRRGDRMEGLHVLFVGKIASGKLESLLAPIHGRPTLVVTESADGLRGDSVINFVVQSEKVRFDVSLPAAESRGLRVSSRLLAVARKVVEAPR